ncbi:hypothetical protein WA026_012221 [Henosepilachna vigintioctopunctata]|uniref:uS12 prolyl 3-hydroxylase n=1 Tax=Henosepilachna vigintioctopunctata TaxID=420089 RepID=A0AAW1V5A2_9CUCU
MDLYEFFQSLDLKHIDLEYIKVFYDFMKSTVMPWVSKLTGYDLVEISATCSCYTMTDYLLVHDDQREDRMVAFVYYLTDNDNWGINTGGSLDLFTKDERGLPSKVVRSIFPKNNQLVIFPVTSDSYHQVTEVLDKEASRMSINGWFHAKTAPVFEIPQFEYPSNSLFGSNKIKPQHSDILLESWIDENYINNDDGTLDNIQKHIEENSEISLTNFFKMEALLEVMNCLNIIEDHKWSKPVPPNRGSYEVLANDSLPFSLERFLNLFCSEQFFAYLKIISDLDLNSLKFELQRWTPGSYSLLSDHNWENTQELDIIIYLIPEENEHNIFGGRIQYVNTDEEIQEALITIEPSQNTLNIVYRDSARFIKYYSKLSTCEKFYLLICSYSE